MNKKKIPVDEDHLNNITLDKGAPQEGYIQVSSQIVNDLSSGIYHSPAMCLKELINNSYDADANIVTIRILPDMDNILVMDDGEGMNAQDFDSNFAWISKSNKRNHGLISKKGRPLIGKIGIGFIAVNEICEKMEIISSKKGEDIKFTATINFREISEDAKQDEGVIKAKYCLQNSDEDREKHYTVIKLVGIKEIAQKILQDKAYRSTIAKKKTSDYPLNEFKSMKEILEYIYDEDISSMDSLPEYLKFMIDLAAYIPVEYVEDGPVEETSDKIIKEIVEYHKKLNFKVDLDGIYLKKPIFLPAFDDLKTQIYSFKETLKSAEKQIKVKGYFYCQNSLLKPRQFNGLAIRIKNIPIAKRYGYDTTFLDYPTVTYQLFRNWISGEIYVDEGLEDAMNIDRASFRETHPEYYALQEFLHKLLNEKILGEIVQGLYEQGKKEREKEENKQESKSRSNILGTKNIEIERRATAKKDPNLNTKKTAKFSPPLTLERKKDSAVITLNTDQLRMYKKKDRIYLEKVFLAFESAYQESNGDIEKLRELFYKKINQWVKEKS